MKFIDEYREKKYIDELKLILNEFNFEREINIMEVCGTHTHSIHKFGIHKILPKNVNHISGPGCPVCVTPTSYIDTAIKLSNIEGNVIVSFGDMIRVPGSKSSLEKEKSKGRDIRIVYSPLDTLNFAKREKEKNFIFLAVGFETTAPSIAATIEEADKENLKNFFILCGNKTLPNALRALIESDSKIDGFILPGHVSTVVGSDEYEFLVEDYNIPCAIAGFEPFDIILGYISILKQINNKETFIANTYLRSVRREGNPLAKFYLRKYFYEVDSEWRGLGIIKNSGLVLKKEYKKFDALEFFKLEFEDVEERTGCMCGDVLKGKVKPTECPLYSNVCIPENPVGPCMISSEGTCAAYYKYG